MSSSFGRIVGVLVSPTKTMEEIATRPTWLVVLVVFMVLGAISAAMVTPKIDFEQAVQQRVEASGSNVDAEQLEQGIAIMERFGWVFGLLGALVFQPLAFVVIALFFWVVFKIQGSEMVFPGSFSVTLHALVPTLIASIVTMLVVMGRETVDAQALQNGTLLASSLGFFAGEETGPVVRTLMSSINFFTLWALVLFGIGYRFAAKVSAQKATVTVVVGWLLWVLIKCGLALLQ